PGARPTSRRDPDRRGAAPRRAASLRPVGAGAARPRRDPRSAHEPHRARVTHGRAALELRRAAPFRARERGRRADRRCFRRARALMLAIAAGLVIGKPVGFLLLSALAVRLGLAVKPQSYSWRQLAGAGCLAGIGFTMALFIAGQAYPLDTEFSAAKVAVFAASTVSALIGVALMWKPVPGEAAVDRRVAAPESTPIS